MKKLLLIVASLMIFLSGCVTPSERNRFQLGAANQICSVDALAQEKQSLLSSSNDQRHSIAPHQNRFGTYTEESRTILEQKLGAYDAEVEAAYRMATQSCTAYNRCLERNHHKETQCLRTESMWTQAQQRFSSLSVDLKLIAAELERERIKAASKKQSERRKQRRRPAECCDDGRDCCANGPNCCEDARNCCGSDHPCRGTGCRHPNHYRPPAQCCDTINSIFTDCCSR